MQRKVDVLLQMAIQFLTFTLKIRLIYLISASLGLLIHPGYGTAYEIWVLTHDAQKPPLNTCPEVSID